MQRNVGGRLISVFAAPVFGATAFAVCSFASLASAAESTPAATATKPAVATTSSKAPTYGLPQVALINEQIRAGWEARGLVGSPNATDGEWCRRVYLDLLGRIPSVKETQEFLNDKSPDKKSKLVNFLLSDSDSRIHDDYIKNWTNIWTLTLIGRPPAMNNNRTMVNRDGMQKYLRDSFATNKPYDQFVHELVSARGNNTPGEQEFNGAVNFLIGNLEEQAANATAKTAKIFLGLQVQCTQCHNHPFNDWKQNQFWELNAFFRQTRGQRKGQAQQGMPNIAELASQNFNGETNDMSKAILFYELRNGQLKSAYPVFVDGTEIDPNGKVSEVDRRKELAKLITGSDYMRKAIVNRMWGHFLGYGFTKPVDDMGPHNPPTHPELLDRLAAEFGSHSHDLKQLMRWIVLSEPYALSSKTIPGDKGNYKDDPSLGEKPAFSHFYLRQMSAEQLYESLLVATEAGSAGNDEERERKKTDWLRQFTLAFGTDEGDDATTFNGTIPQTLMMFNGDLIKQATSTSNGGFLDKIVRDAKLNDIEKMSYLYMAALSRKPTKTELDWAVKLHAARKGDAVGALQDIFWVVLNTGEFIFNH